MSTYLYLDIETLPPQWSPAQIEAHARANVPGNISKPETIEKWVAENAGEYHAKLALDWRHSRILCLATAAGDAEPTVSYSEECAPRPILDHLDAAIRGAMRESHGAMPKLVGHFLLGFDLPRLYLLACRERHPVAALLPWEKWSKRLVCTKELASGPDPRALTAKLSDLATYLGLGAKGEGLDGSEVWPAYQRGEHQRIADYCAQDVRLCRDVHRALTGDWR